VLTVLDNISIFQYNQILQFAPYSKKCN